MLNADKITAKLFYFIIFEGNTIVLQCALLQFAGQLVRSSGCPDPLSLRGAKRRGNLIAGSRFYEKPAEHEQVAGRLPRRFCNRLALTAFQLFHPV